LPTIALAFGKRHKVAQEAIVQQLTEKSIKHSRWWLFLLKKDKEERKGGLLIEYSAVFEEAKREGLVDVAEDNELKDEDGNILNPSGRPFLIPNDLGDKYISEFWLRFLFDNTYAKTIIAGLVVALVGTYINNIFKDINPNSTVDVNPIINIYPDKE